MDIKKIKELINIVEETEINSLAIEEGDTKIEIKKQAAGQPIYASAPQLAAAPAVAIAKTAKPAEEAQGLIAVKSPMAGTFYGSPSPDAPPYVRVGESISAGKPVCIIEAMKTFNEIEAEVSGTVEKILVKNQDPVEFGQVLMLVKE